MPFIIRKDLFFSFLLIIFIPLVVMAFFSITTFNKIEKFNENNLETNLRTVKLLYESSSHKLQEFIIDKSNTLIIDKDLNKKLEEIKSEGKIDILFILEPDEINISKRLYPIFKQASKNSVCSTEIIPDKLIKKYYKKDLNKLLIQVNSPDQPVIAGIAQISANNIKNSKKILVGIKFLKLDEELHRDISRLLKGNLLFIQNDYVITEIAKDKQKNKNFRSKINTQYLSGAQTLTKLISLFRKDYIYIIDPIYNYHKSPIGAILIAKSKSDITSLKKQNTAIIILTILTIASIISLAVYVTSQNLMNSIEQITDVARSVKYGDLSKRVKIKAGNRIAQLGVNINKMIEALQDRESRIKEYQMELQKQKEYFEALFNSLADGVITVSKDCKITKINPTIAIWGGLEEENIIGRKLTDILNCECDVNCQDPSKHISEICPLISQNERLAPTEAQISNHQTGSEKLLSLNFSPVSGFEGDPTYVIVLRDITEIKEMDRLREDFVATLTHDLRVPILAEATTLKFFLKGNFGSYTDKQREAIGNMLESNNGLLRLVNSLLDTYKYDANEDELVKETINIRKLVQDCVSELTPIARKNNQSLTNLITKEMPAVRADKNEIKRVIINLVNNALDYTPKGGSIVIDAEKGEQEITVKVIDNGKGIAESELEVIFNRFFSKAKKFRKIGTGLGLYLSKKIIEKHNGKIWAESKLGKGSTFYFNLPLDN